MVDRDFTTHDAELAGRVEVIPGLDLRLASIDTAKGEDRYMVMQGLRDSSVAGTDAKCCYFYRRSGGTGTRGEINLEGPMEQPKVHAAIAAKFKEMTDFEFGSVEPGHRGKPGLFWLQQTPTPDLTVKWQYFVNDGVDGKKEDWYPYEAGASAEVEEIYAQHVANSREARTATRLVHSGYFTYKVDLETMSQENTKTHKKRTIRRATGAEAEKRPGGKVPKSKRKEKPMKAMVAPKKMVAKAPGMPGMKVKKAKVDKMVTKAGMKKETKKEAKKEAAKKKAAKMKEAKKKKEAAKKKAAKIKTVGTKREVWRGKAKRSGGGLKKDNLKVNKYGRVVSKKASARGKERFSKVAVWVAALLEARKVLGLTGKHMPVKSSAYYAKAIELKNSGTIKPYEPKFAAGTPAPAAGTPAPAAGPPAPATAPAALAAAA